MQRGRHKDHLRSGHPGTRSRADSPCGRAPARGPPSALPAASSGRSPTRGFPSHAPERTRSLNTHTTGRRICPETKTVLGMGAFCDACVCYLPWAHHPSGTLSQQFTHVPWAFGPPGALHARALPSPWPTAAARARSLAPYAAALRAAPLSEPPPPRSCTRKPGEPLRMHAHLQMQRDRSSHLSAQPELAFLLTEVLVRDP